MLALDSNNQSLGIERAKVMADRLMGFFPTIAATDPEIFITGLVQLLAAYPFRVVEAVLSPLNGIPSKHKFLPSIAEVKAELDDRYAPILRAAERERACNQTVRLRIAGPVAPRPTREELRARYPHFLQKVAAVDNKPRPRREARTDHWVQLGAANRRALERECHQAGVDPDRGYSPGLEKLLRNED
jgi:hypothetical protein